MISCPNPATSSGRLILLRQKFDDLLEVTFVKQLKFLKSECLEESVSGKEIEQIGVHLSFKEFIHQASEEPNQHHWKQTKCCLNQIKSLRA